MLAMIILYIFEACKVTNCYSSPKIWKAISSHTVKNHIEVYRGRNSVSFDEVEQRAIYDNQVQNFKPVCIFCMNKGFSLTYQKKSLDLGDTSNPILIEQVIL